MSLVCICDNAVWLRYLFGTSGVVISDLNWDAFRTLRVDQVQRIVSHARGLAVSAVIPLVVTNVFWMCLAVWTARPPCAACKGKSNTPVDKSSRSAP
jgi:hypothetical protein